MNPLTTSVAPTLRINRTFAASRERVFAAWTDVDFVRRWLAPTGTISEAHWDAREGASYRMVMEQNGFVVKGVFSEVTPPEKLAFTFRWEEDEPALERDTFVTVELLDRGHETEMIFTQTAFRDEASLDNHRNGWGMSFDNLARLVSA